MNNDTNSQPLPSLSLESGRPSRRRILGLLAGLGAVHELGFPWPVDAAETPPPTEEDLFQGVTGLSRTREFKFMEGHYPAALLSGHFFLRERDLNDATRAAVRSQMNKLAVRYASMFKPQPKSKPSKSYVEQLVEAIGENIVDLRRGAHDVIFAVHALKAVSVNPDLATAPVVEGICDLLKQEKRKRKPESSRRDDWPQSYENRDDLIRSTFEEVLSSGRLYGGPYSNYGRAVHWVTHANALVELEALGYPELSKKGYRAHRIHLTQMDGYRPDDRHSPRVANELDPLKSPYWERDLENWNAGHVFKFLDSYYRLRSSVPKDLVSRCDERRKLLH